MIIPALLTDQRQDLVTMLDLCSGFTDYVQVDIMDGVFVPSQSIGLSDLEGLKCPCRAEAHLMVTDPLAWLDSFKKFGAERIIYSFEINKDHRKIIAKIKEVGLNVGLAVNPSTNIDDFKSLADEVDSLLFMSVNPGFYGAKFIPQVLDKIKAFRSQYPEINIGIDGGIKLDNASLAKAAGVNDICVGSAILKAENPKQAYSEFTRLING